MAKEISKKNIARLKELTNELYDIAEEEGITDYLQLCVRTGGIGGGSKSIDILPRLSIFTFSDMEGWSDEDGYTHKSIIGE